MSDETSLDDLVAEAQADPSNNSPAMVLILARFERLAVKIGHDVARAKHIRDDATNGARWGIVLAVRSHNIGIAGFPNFAKIYMRREAVRWAKDADVSVVPLARDLQKPGWEDTPARGAPADTTFEVIDLIRMLTPKQQAITVAYYIADLRLSDIALNLGISKPAVSQRLSTIHRSLRPVVEEALAA
jgi:RNA polymerase sigma factor (sigma-70 family)